MFLDHFGLLFFKDGTLANAWLRGFGRLSMPLFAFMIAEGCRYTKNKVKHFFLLFGLAVLVDKNTGDCDSCQYQSTSGNSDEFLPAIYRA